MVLAVPCFCPLLPFLLPLNHGRVWMGRDLKDRPVPTPAGSCHLRDVLLHTKSSLWEGGGIPKGTDPQASVQIHRLQAGMKAGQQLCVVKPKCQGRTFLCHDYFKGNSGSSPFHSSSCVSLYHTDPQGQLWSHGMCPLVAPCTLRCDTHLAICSP